MKYAFIGEHAAAFSVERLCRVLGVGRSGYYAWRERPVSPREQANQTLLGQIRSAYQTSRQTYGSPRVYHALRGQGVGCGRHRVARLMRQAGLVARGKRKFHPRTTQSNPRSVPAPNRLGQDFSAQAPNQKWGVDLTYIATGEGWLYLAVVLDLFSRRIVGWAMSERMDTALVENALRMALGQRHPPAGLLHHSDRGSQYTSAGYRACLQAALVELSMSGTGNCYDNAVVESFFASLKAECAPAPFVTRAQARTVIFEYLEIWYNRQRIHSALDYLSPAEFEHQFPF